MPVYEYSCPSCGPFEELVAMDAAGEPAACPSCDRLAPRTYSLAIGPPTSSPAQRAMRERAESGEPRREARTGASAGHAPHRHPQRERPWMIGH